MLRRLRSFALPLFACLPFAACGDDSTASPATPLQSSLSDDTQVGSLDDTQQAAFCQEVATWYGTQVSLSSAKKLACYSFALAFSGGSSQACSQAASECIASEEEFTTSPAIDCDTTRLDGCTATVGELEGCFTATVTRVREIAASISCGMSPSTLASLGTPPAACAPVQSKCPQLFDDAEEL